MKSNQESCQALILPTYYLFYFSHPNAVNYYRFTIYRSTVLAGDEVSTGPRNVHLDMNPWWWLESSEDILTGVEAVSYSSEHDFIKENNLVVRSMGMHIQCVMNFLDNLEEDGGTIIVPKFHKYISNCCTKSSQIIDLNHSPS